MKLGRTASILGAIVVCSIAAYFCAEWYWIQKTKVVIPGDERAVMQTGTISTTNGWEFKLVKVLDFGRRDADHLVFCPKTRQVFIAFGDKKDDKVYQWDLDRRKLVQTFCVGQGLLVNGYSVSSDENYLHVGRRGTDGREWEPVVFDVRTKTEVRRPGANGEWISYRQYPNIWTVPLSKGGNGNDGLFYRDRAGKTNLITKDFWWNNYAATKGGRVIITATWHDDIILWDTETGKEIARQRITNHQNGAGYIVYDEDKDRFLIADPSAWGVKFLRALIITKRPAKNPSPSA